MRLFTLVQAWSQYPYQMPNCNEIQGDSISQLFFCVKIHPINHMVYSRSIKLDVYAPVKLASRVISSEPVRSKL